jgi:hypothetical protein
MNEAALARHVRKRAGYRCEYCHLPQAFHPVPFELDHVIARKHGGRTNLANLALSCLRCNSFKGPNIAGIDPFTKKLTPLFHPRKHRWRYHFEWNGPQLAGRTAIGRTTIQVLGINEPDAIRVRAALMEEGLLEK